MAVSSARDAFFEVARSEGARYLFSNPGTTELPIFDELASGDAGVELILCLHEAVAVGAADGYAQATGRPSLVNLHILPGLANGLCHMANAAWSRSPVVVTAGQQDTRHLVQEPMLAGDLVGLAKRFSKYAYECRRPDEVGVVMRRAFKEAATPPTGPTFVSIPWDTLDEPAQVEVPDMSSIDIRGGAAPEAVRRAAQLIAQAERPMIIAGDEVARSGAVTELVALAEQIGARVMGEPVYGRLVFPHDHALWGGGMYPNNAAIRGLLSSADVVIVAGAIAFAPLLPSPIGAIPAECTVIQIDCDAHQIAKTYPVAEGLWGDVRTTLRMLVDELPSTAAALERVATIGKEREDAIASLDAFVASSRAASPVKPMVAAAEILAACEPGTAIVDDAVTGTAGVRTMLRANEPGSYYFTRGGGLGWGIPAAIGVKLADRDRPVVAIVGDGTSLYAPQALWTLAHHDLPVVTVVLNNRSYLILKQGMQGMAGKAAKSGTYPGMDLVDPAVDFSALAKSFGVAGERIEKASQIGSAISSALASKRPALIEIDIDGSL